MKTKTGRIIFTPLLDENGKQVVRKARYGEYFLRESGAIAKCTLNDTSGSYPIYTRIEEEIEWKPEMGNHYRFADITDKDLWNYSKYNGDEIDKLRLELNLVFPCTDEGRKMAIERSKEIISLIKENGHV